MVPGVAADGPAAYGQLARSAPVWLLAVGVAAMPFIKPFHLRVVGKELIAADIVFIACGIAWALAVARKQVGVRRGKFLALWALCFVSLAVSLAASQDRAGSLGVFVQRSYAMGLGLLSYFVVTSHRSLVLVFRGWLTGTALMTVAMIVGAVAFFFGLRDPAVNLVLWGFGSLPNVGLPRLAGFMMNGNAACSMLAMSGGLAGGWLAAKQRPGRDWMLAAILLCAAAALTMSPGLGGLALVVGAFAWLKTRGTALGWVGRILVAGAVAAALAMLVVTMLDPGGRGSDGSLASSRVLAWLSSLETIRAYPLLGKGVGLGVAEVHYTNVRGVDEYLTSAHNTWLSLAGQQGLVGLLCFGWLIGYVVRRAWPPVLVGSSPLLAETAALRTGLLIGLGCAAGYQSLSAALENQRHLWVMLGLLAAAGEGLGLPAASTQTTQRLEDAP